MTLRPARLKERPIRLELATTEQRPDAKRRGAARDKDAPTRRCLVSGDTLPKEVLVRFVVGPDGSAVMDLAERLPGRGLWLRACRDTVNTAVKKKLFARAARAAVTTPADLADRVAAALTRRCLDTVGLARRAGVAVAGHDKAREWLKAGRGGLLLLASDASAGEAAKMRAAAGGIAVSALFGREELGSVFGREQAVHVVIAPGALAEKLVRECGRLEGFRDITAPSV